MVAPSAVQQGSLVGQRLDKYEILALLAVGGTAEIYLARIGGEAGFEKYVVVKCLLDHLADDEDFVRMFLDEARLAAQLEHSNIVQTLALGQYKSRYYIVMEYLAGMSLAQLARRTAERVPGGLMPVDLVLGLAAQTCGGLHYAHKMKTGETHLKLVHRDVSPQNLVVSFDGVLKLVDFGIAKAELRETHTRSGTIKGKFAYMSPEQCQAQDIDHRTDIFALGVILHELLTGRRLFKRNTSYETYQTIISGRIPEPTSVNHKIDPALNDIVMRALAYKKEDRFPDAQAFGEALLGHLHRRGTSISSADVSRYFDQHFEQELEEHGERMRELIEGRSADPVADQQWDDELGDLADVGDIPPLDELDGGGEGDTRIELNPLDKIKHLHDAPASITGDTKPMDVGIGPSSMSDETREALGKRAETAPRSPSAKKKPQHDDTLAPSSSSLGASAPADMKPATRALPKGKSGFGGTAGDPTAPGVLRKPKLDPGDTVSGKAARASAPIGKSGVGTNEVTRPALSKAGSPSQGGDSSAAKGKTKTETKTYVSPSGSKAPPPTDEAPVSDNRPTEKNPLLSAEAGSSELSTPGGTAPTPPSAPFESGPAGAESNEKTRPKEQLFGSRGLSGMVLDKEDEDEVEQSTLPTSLLGRTANKAGGGTTGGVGAPSTNATPSTGPQEGAPSDGLAAGEPAHGSGAFPTGDPAHGSGTFPTGDPAQHSGAFPTGDPSQHSGTFPTGDPSQHSGTFPTGDPSQHSGAFPTGPEFANSGAYPLVADGAIPASGAMPAFKTGAYSPTDAQKLAEEQKKKAFVYAAVFVASIVIGLAATLLIVSTF